MADNGGPLAAVDDRAFEAWEPLLAIALLAGDEQIERAVAVALTLSNGRDVEPETHRLRLLRDIRLVFDGDDDRKGVGDRIGSQALADELAADADSPWADWYGKPVTPVVVARFLRPFMIRPRSVRFEDGSTPKGYLREQFEEVWNRYAPRSSASKPQHRHNPVAEPKTPDFKPPQESLVAAGRIERKPAPAKGCGGCCG